MGKVSRTFRIDAELSKKLNKIVEAPYTFTWHLEQALASYGPIKKLIAKPAKPKYSHSVKAFVKPDLYELSMYFQEKGSLTCNDDAQDFLDHFDSNGWRVGGKAPMKCWKASVRKWIKRKDSFAVKSKHTVAEDDFMKRHTDKSWHDEV